MIHKISKKSLKLIYNVFIGILSLSIIIILIFEDAGNLTARGMDTARKIDNIIWMIFVVDYFTRLIISENKKIFIKKNIIDLIAIIPFNMIFQSLRIVESTKLFKTLKLVNFLRSLRALAFFFKFEKCLNEFIKTNKFNYILQLTIVTILMGGVGMHFAEGRTLGDSIWLSFVTTTTVGYGDISPSTIAGRIIASILMLTGIGFIGTLTSTISAYFIDRKAKKVRKNFKYKVLDTIKEELDHFDSLSNEDVNNICKTLIGLKNK
ncbi:potassium channel family protein [Clostridium sp. AWRP]|uniref:potassium channel family protein n=1 Tax=Clostridium sp. AWRP TaxID=2212991 RepID=UPI000FDADF0F|nr:potassium channel family protein [Clostridium sp. AWRP]AZV55596.1 two pore domain potassium channel family protein [Clostridium sp. AWRP]